MKKIVFIIGHLAYGGAERVVVTLANKLSRHYEVSIIMISGDEVSYDLESSIKIESIKVDKFKSNKLKYFVTKILYLRKKVKSLNPDLVISFMGYINMYSIVSTRFLNTKVIVSERIYPKIDKSNRKFEIARNILYHLANGCVFQTPDAANCFSKRIKYRSTIIGNPLKPNLPINNSNSRKKEIVAVGRLCEQKNYTLLIESFKEVQKKYKEYKLIIYGVGPLEKELKNKYEELIAKNALEFKGFEKNIHEKILNSRMFVLASDYEGMPNALMESMAIGLPCIATDSMGGGAKILTSNGKKSILIPRNNKEILIEKIKELIEDDHKVKQLSVEGSEYIRSNYSTERIVNEWKEYMEKIINS